MRSPSEWESSKLLASENLWRDSGQKIGGIRKLIWIALLAAFATVLFTFESLFPHPIPWLRMGLSHVATLLALYLLGGLSALGVVFVRVMATGLILGFLFQPSFFLSLVGGLGATSAMYLTQRRGRCFGPVGVSIVGAVTHNLLQLVMADVLFVHAHAILNLLPLFLIASLAGGLFVGLASYFLLMALIPKFLKSKGKVSQGNL